MISSEIDPNLSVRNIMRQPPDAGWPSLGQMPVATAGQTEESPFIFRAADATDFMPEITSERIRPQISIDAHDREIKSQVQRFLDTRDREITLQMQRFLDTISSYEDRINVLKEQAEAEGYSLNEASGTAFWNFLKKHPFMRRGRLVLLENGNLRAVWSGGNDAHIGLQFLNERLIQYVIFARRGPDAPVSRVAGRDTMEGIMRQIDAFDLRGIL